MNDSQQETDGYTYNSHRNIRTSNTVERLYQDRDDNFIAFIYSVQYKDSEGQWFNAGSRWAFNTDDVAFIISSGFKSFPSISK